MLSTEFTPTNLDDPQITKQEFGCAGCSAAEQCSGTAADHLKFTGEQSPFFSTVGVEEYLANKNKAEQPPTPNPRRSLNILGPEIGATSDDEILTEVDQAEILQSADQDVITESTITRPEEIASPLLLLRDQTETIKSSVFKEVLPPIPSTEFVHLQPPLREPMVKEHLEETDQTEGLSDIFKQDPEQAAESLRVIKAELGESHVETYSTQLLFKQNAEGHMDLFFDGSELGVLESWNEERVSGPGELNKEHMLGIVSQLLESGHALAVVTTTDGKVFTYLYETGAEGVMVREFVEKQPEPAEVQPRKSPEYPKQPTEPGLGSKPNFSTFKNEPYRLQNNENVGTERLDPLTVRAEVFVYQNALSREINGIYIEELGTHVVNEGIPQHTTISNHLETPQEYQDLSSVAGSDNLFSNEKPLEQPDHALETTTVNLPDHLGTPTPDLALKTQPELEKSVVRESDFTDSIDDLWTMEEPVDHAFKLSAVEPAKQNVYSIPALNGDQENLFIPLSIDQVRQDDSLLDRNEFSVISKEAALTDEDFRQIEMDTVPKLVTEPNLNELPSETVETTEQVSKLPTDTNIPELKMAAAGLKIVRVKDLESSTEEQMPESNEKAIEIPKPDIYKQIIGNQTAVGAETSFNSHGPKNTVESASQTLAAFRAFKNLENIPRRESRASKTPPPVSINDELLASVISEVPSQLDGAEIERLAA